MLELFLTIEMSLVRCTKEIPKGNKNEEEQLLT